MYASRSIRLINSLIQPSPSYISVRRACISPHYCLTQSMVSGKPASRISYLRDASTPLFACVCEQGGDRGTVYLFHLITAYVQVTRNYPFSVPIRRTRGLIFEDDATSPPKLHSAASSNFEREYALRRTECRRKDSVISEFATLLCQSSRSENPVEKSQK